MQYGIYRTSSLVHLFEFNMIESSYEYKRYKAKLQFANGMLCQNVTILIGCVPQRYIEFHRY